MAAVAPPPLASMQAELDDLRAAEAAYAEHAALLREKDALIAELRRQLRRPAPAEADPPAAAGSSIIPEP